MKKFTAVYWRSNPQFKNGGYETKRIVEARTLQSAKKKAEKINQPLYGSLDLMDVYEYTEG